jgi:hypothetical protein
MQNAKAYLICDAEVQAEDFAQNEKLFVQYVLNCSGKII